MEEPKEPRDVRQKREKVELSQKRSGSVEAKTSKGSCSKGYRGE